MGDLGFWLWVLLGMALCVGIAALAIILRDKHLYAAYDIKLEGRVINIGEYGTMQHRFPATTRRDFSISYEYSYEGKTYHANETLYTGDFGGRPFADMLKHGDHVKIRISSGDPHDSVLVRPSLTLRWLGRSVALFLVVFLIVLVKNLLIPG